MSATNAKPVPVGDMVLASMFSALIAAGAYISVPIPGSPVPIVLQNLFVLLAGLLLGWRWAAVSVGVYLFIGLIGLPVFSGGSGGFAHFLGPTGGYLVGFLAAAAVAGLIANGTGPARWQLPQKPVPAAWNLLRDVAAVIAATVVVYAFGLPWLKAVAGLSWAKAAAAGVLPFIAGDLLKAAAAVAAVRLLEPVLRTAAGRGFVPAVRPLDAGPLQAGAQDAPPRSSGVRDVGRGESAQG